MQELCNRTRPGHLHTASMRQYFMSLFIERLELIFTLLPSIALASSRYELLYVIRFWLYMSFFFFPLTGSRLL